MYALQLFLKVVNGGYVDSNQRIMCYIKSKTGSTKLFTELSKFDKGTNYTNTSTELVNASLETLWGTQLWKLSQIRSVTLLEIHANFFKLASPFYFLVSIWIVLSLIPLSGFLFFFFKLVILFYLFIFRERGREGEREEEKDQCVVASHAPPTRDLAYNPGMCPDWESNQQLFGLQARSFVRFLIVNI